MQVPPHFAKSARHTTHYLRIVIPRHAADRVLTLRPWSNADP